MKYSEAVDYLFQKLPMYQKVGQSALKKGLDNIISLCAVLDNPQDKFKSIHIAGTNGKGSVSHFLSAVFTAAGYKTALYTSPHLIDYRERIKIDGELISKQAVIAFIKKIDPVIEELQPSFFEITVAMAFNYFAQKKVDIAIIETGLGGRLDSTNILTPILSVITNIGLEHQQMLGETLEEIAGEKAGIIKMAIPVLIGKKNKITNTVFKEKAKKTNSPVFFAQDLFSLEESKQSKGILSLSLKDNFSKKTIKLKTNFSAAYQKENLTTVLAAIQLVQDQGFFSISKTAITKGIKQTDQLTGFAGRWQKVAAKPTTIVDCAHNKDGIQALVEQLKLMEYDKLHVIFGSVQDKNHQEIFELLPKRAKYYFAPCPVPRSAQIESLVEKAKKEKLSVSPFDHVSKAYAAAVSASNGGDLILVCGSVFLVGEFLKVSHLDR